MRAIMQWGARHKVPHAAMLELRAIMSAAADGVVLPEGSATTEAGVQNAVRAEAARCGVRLWRNNVGVLLDATGRPVRYGLANDSATLNAQLKSSDLIGWRRLVVTPEHVGTTIAQFVCREVKKPGWHYTGSQREAAQLTWINMVLADGGDAAFVCGLGSF